NGQFSRCRNFHFRCCSVRVPQRRWLAQFLSSQCRDFACQTEMTQQIATVWCDLDIENRIRGEKITVRHADFCILRQYKQARSIVAETDLEWTAKNYLRFDTRQLVFHSLI